MSKTEEVGGKKEWNSFLQYKKEERQEEKRERESRVGTVIK